MRDELEAVLLKLYKEKRLATFSSHAIEPNMLIVAPFRDGDSVTYHRALVLKMLKQTKKPMALVKYVDYGDIECVPLDQLYAMPNAPPLLHAGQHSDNTPFLAVRYKLR